MNSSISRRGRQRLFAGVVLGCIALAVGYTSWVILRADAGPNYMQTGSQGTPLSIAGLNELQAVQHQPHLLFVNLKKPEMAQVKIATLDAAFPQRAQTP